MYTAIEINSALEATRLEILRSYEILDTPPDDQLDGLTKLAARLFNVPVALISLVDQDRIWLKSRFGIDVQELPREPGFCDSAILSNDFYLVEDSRKNPQMLDNSLVSGEEKILFYAGVPLHTKEGYNLGTFCIMDRKTRSFSNANREILRNMAEMVLNQIELHLEVRNSMKHQHQLLNTAAHDLKNPLSVMPLLADLIMHHKHDPKAIDDIAKQIKEAGKRMSGVVDMLLESAVEEAGRIMLRLKSVDFAPLVTGVLNSNAALAKNKNQSLHLNIIRESEVFADPRRLTEIVDNLLNNAIKYSPLGSNILVTLGSTEKFAVLEVRDEGQGLTRDDLKNLYRRFTSLSATPTGGENSTGLGLSIVKNLVEAHHGKISAHSEGPGKGATFTVEIPLSENS